MRHRQAVALAAVALFGLTGCGADPDELKPNYEDMNKTSAPPTTTSASVSVAVATPTPTPVKQAQDLDALAGKALLTDSDLVAEGVHPGEGQVSGCLTDSVSTTSRTSTWLYPTGSVLRHRVAAYPDKPAAEVVAAATCAGKDLALDALSGVDRQRAWCDGATCTVLLAKGNLVSVLTVSASNESRATLAAKRLAPIVAAKLTAQP